MLKLESLGYNPVFVAKQLLETVEEEFLEGKNFSEEEMISAYSILSEGFKDINYHPFPYSALFFHLYKLSYFKEVKKISELVGNIKVSEQKVETKEVIKPSNNGGKAKEISKESDEKINQIVDLFGAKLIKLEKK